MSERDVEFAVGFVGGQWSEVIVTVPEHEDMALDDEEVTEAAEKLIEKMKFSSPVAFYHVLYISEPVGGFGDDSY